MAMNLASGTMPAGEATRPSAAWSVEELAEKFPQFEILECLGRGGMGIVYKARQKALDRDVAIKILAGEWQDEAGFAERFKKEAKVLARLNHANIVTVHDFGETDGLYYIVMEFVDGVNLRDVLRDGKIEAPQALAIVPPICEALQSAHDQGVVHRDIKPENLLLDRDGRIKIADFGIATLAGDRTDRSGTPEYMAPEQKTSEQADHRADIYALGVVLYEMLTGERPQSSVVAPSARVEIDVRLDEVVLRALESKPEKRYQTAAEFRSVVQTTVRPGGEATERPRKRYRVSQAVLLLIVLLGLVLLFNLREKRMLREFAQLEKYRRSHPTRGITNPVPPVLAAKPGEHRVQIDEDRSFEVFALTRDPRAGGTWWTPDGSPFLNDPVKVLNLHEPISASAGKPVAPTNEFLIHYQLNAPFGKDAVAQTFSWQPNPIRLKKTDSQPSILLRPSGHIWKDVAHFALPDGTDSLDLKANFIFADAVWETVATYDGTQTKELLKGSMVVFSPPRYEANTKRHVIEVMHNLSRTEHSLRLIAELKNGERKELAFHGAISTGTPAKGLAMIYPGEFELADVRRYELQRTPWIRCQINDIALNPDRHPVPKYVQPGAALAREWIQLIQRGETIKANHMVQPREITGYESAVTLARLKGGKFTAVAEASRALLAVYRPPASAEQTNVLVIRVVRPSTDPNEWGIFDMDAVSEAELQAQVDALEALTKVNEEIRLTVELNRDWMLDLESGRLFHDTESWAQRAEGPLEGMIDRGIDILPQRGPDHSGKFGELRVLGKILRQDTKAWETDNPDIIERALEDQKKSGVIPLPSANELPVTYYFRTHGMPANHPRVGVLQVLKIDSETNTLQLRYRIVTVFARK